MSRTHCPLKCSTTFDCWKVLELKVQWIQRWLYILFPDRLTWSVNQNQLLIKKKKKKKIDLGLRWPLIIFLFFLRYHTPNAILTVSYAFQGSLDGSAGKECTCNAGDTGGTGSIPRTGKIPWRRKWQPTPVLLPGEFHGQRSLVGYSAWGLKESNVTEWITLSTFFPFLCQSYQGIYIYIYIYR